MSPMTANRSRHSRCAFRWTKIRPEKFCREVCAQDGEASLPAARGTPGHPHPWGRMEDGDYEVGPLHDLCAEVDTRFCDHCATKTREKVPLLSKPWCYRRRCLPPGDARYPQISPSPCRDLAWLEFGTFVADNTNADGCAIVVRKCITTLMSGVEYVVLCEGTDLISLRTERGSSSISKVHLEPSLMQSELCQRLLRIQAV